MKKLVLKESQDYFNYSVEWRRAENSRLVATAAIVVSIIAAFFSLLNKDNCVVGAWSLLLAAFSVVIFVIGCISAIICLFKALLCVYYTPPSTFEKIKELEKIMAAENASKKLDFMNSLSASNAVTSYNNVQSGIAKAGWLSKAVHSIKVSCIGLLLFTIELHLPKCIELAQKFLFN